MTPEAERVNVNLRRIGLEENRQESPNCISYVYFRLGITNEERFIELGPLAPHLNLFDEVDDTAQADVVTAVFTWREMDQVCHMTVIDKDDREFVFERAMTGKPVRRVKIEEALSPYLNGTDNLIKALYLRLKASNP